MKKELLSIPLLTQRESETEALGDLDAINLEYRQANKSNPTSAFELIEAGFIENYSAVKTICGRWFSELVDSSNARSSDIYNRMLQVKDYVLYGSYQLTEEDAETFDIAEYEAKIRNRDVFHLPLVTSLYENIEAIHQFWLLSEHQNYLSNDKRSINQRCFALFAKTGWVRLRVDFGIPGEYRSKIVDEDYYDPNPLYMVCELALLVGQTTGSVKNAIAKHRQKNNGYINFASPPDYSGPDSELLSPKLRIYSDGYGDETYSEVTEYFTKGYQARALENYLSHREAIIFLNTKKEFKPSKFYL